MARPIFAPSRWGDRRRTRVGILGGSFNPAHAGHLHISEDAYRRMGLDEVWWLISPQNPLKPTAGMGEFEARLQAASAIADHPWIKVTGIEQALGSNRTWATLRVLKKRFPKVRFVWLMGADNLSQIPKWRRWSNIFQSVHIAVFDRSPYSYKALFGQAARRFAHRRLTSAHASAVWSKKRPMWMYAAQRRHGASSTEIRRSQPIA